MKKLVSAFGFALSGLRNAFKTERNFRIEILCAVLVCAAGYYFEITRTEWLIVILNIGAVLSAELLNTAIERLCDVFSPELHPAVKIIKDTSAAAVLITAAAAAITGGVIFVPYCIQFMNST